MFAAIVDEDIEAVASLLARGVDINARNKFGWTILMWSAKTKHFDIFKLLLDMGADVNLADDDANTALHCLAKLESKSSLEDVVKPVCDLLSLGADIDARNHQGATPLMMAAAHMAQDGRVFELLLRRTANFRLADLEGSTALHYLVKNPKSCSSLVNAVSSLLSLEADLDAGDRRGVTPLMTAALNFTMDGKIVKLLLDRRAKVKLADLEGNTALHYLARMEVKSSSTSSSWDALAEILTGLVALGADLDAKNHKGVTALMIAAANLGEADKIFELLVARGADFECADNEGNLALHHLIKNNRKSSSRISRAVSSLVSSGADLDARTQNDKGRTALMMSADNLGDGKILKLLLSKGANVGLRDHQEANTALHCLLKMDKKYSTALMCKSIRRLVDAGVDLDARDQKGRTALMLADNEEIFEALLKTGAGIFGFEGIERKWKNVVKHFAKLKVVGVDEVDVAVTRNRKYGNFLTKCLQELNHAKSWGILDFLIHDEVSLVGMVELDRDYPYDEFPIYGDDLRRVISDAADRRRFRDDAAVSLSKACPKLNRDHHDIVVDVVVFLKEKHWLKLRK